MGLKSRKKEKKRKPELAEEMDEPAGGENLRRRALLLRGEYW